MVEKLSLEKAKIVLKRHPDAVIIAADTTVFLNGKILGKPTSKQGAKDMLKKLSGKKHKAITGFTILDKSKIITEHVTAQIWFRKLSEEEVNAYVSSGEPVDKAGAYAIQGKGGLFIEKIEGDFSGVVGLPLTKLSKSLKEFEIDVIKNWQISKKKRAQS